MNIPKNILDHARIGNFTLVLYKWSALSETSSPRIWENVEFFDEKGHKMWTVNGMENCQYWDNDIDMFVGIGNDRGNWILNSYSGNSFKLDIETGTVTFLSFSK